MGLVADIFNNDVINRLEGTAAIGHNRYSTTGSTSLKNCQPLVVEYAGGGLRSLTMATWSISRTCGSGWKPTDRCSSHPRTARS